MSNSNRIEIKDELLGQIFRATYTRTRKRDAFYVVLSRTVMVTPSAPMKLSGRSWEEAQKQARTLLFMARAAARCGLGHSDYGLPPDLAALESEVPAFTAQSLEAAIHQMINPPTSN
jgi:hypothetical protein